LIVACEATEVVGVLQLYFIPHLTFQGSWRATIEGLRVASQYRSQGIGQKLFEWAIARAKARGCHLLQITTNKARPDALRFYENLGFVASHEGLKLYL
jgi:GNAT superfamily N-acetyltransferase